MLIKENKKRIEAFKDRGIYELVRIDKNPFRTITVDEVIAGLVEENQEEQTGSDVLTMNMMKPVLNPFSLLMTIQMTNMILMKNMTY